MLRRVFNNAYSSVKAPSLLRASTMSRGIKSIEDRSAEKEKKAFQEDIQFFLSKDSFTLFDFHERVMHGLS